MSTASFSSAAPTRRRRAAAWVLRRPAGTWSGWLLLVVLVFPVYWMVSTAFKPDDEINSLTPTWFPLHPTFDALPRRDQPAVLLGRRQEQPDHRVATVAPSMVLAFLAAVALAKFRFTGRKLFIVLMIGILMLPQAGLIIPLYVVLARYHLTNALTGVIITYMTFVLPFAVWTLRGFILGIPKELEEAAMVDGSSRLGAFIRILLPLVAPGLVATSVFVFITAWNEYIFANVLLTDQSNQTLTVWLSYFYGTSRHTDWGGAHGGVDARSRSRSSSSSSSCSGRSRSGSRPAPSRDERRRSSAWPRACILPRLRGRPRPTGSGASSTTGSAGSCCSRATCVDREQLRRPDGGAPRRARDVSSRSTRRAAT